MSAFRSAEDGHIPVGFAGHLAGAAVVLFVVPVLCGLATLAFPEPDYEAARYIEGPLGPLFFVLASLAMSPVYSWIGLIPGALFSLTLLIRGIAGWGSFVAMGLLLGLIGAFLLQSVLPLVHGPVLALAYWACLRFVAPDVFRPEKKGQKTSDDFTAD